MLPPNAPGVERGIKVAESSGPYSSPNAFIILEHGRLELQSGGDLSISLTGGFLWRNIK